MYSFKTKNWSYLKNKLPLVSDGPKSNFVNIGEDLVYYEPGNASLYKWDEDEKYIEGGTQAAYSFRYQTPFFDFGQKSVQKILKRVYITIRTRHLFTSLGCFFAIDQDTPLQSFTAQSKNMQGNVIRLGTNGTYQTSDGIHTAVVELVPPSDNRKFYGLSLVLTNTSYLFFRNDGDIEILDLSITYREKAVR